MKRILEILSGESAQGPEESLEQWVHDMKSTFEKTIFVEVTGLNEKQMENLCGSYLELNSSEVKRYFKVDYRGEKGWKTKFYVNTDYEAMWDYVIRRLKYDKAEVKDVTEDRRFFMDVNRNQNLFVDVRGR